MEVIAHAVRRAHFIITGERSAGRRGDDDRGSADTKFASPAGNWGRRRKEKEHDAHQWCHAFTPATGEGQRFCQWARTGGRISRFCRVRLAYGLTPHPWPSPR